MKDLESRLKEKLSPEDFELASELLSLSISRIRSFIDEKAEEVALR